MTANTIAYTYGCELALIKLGTEAGPIAHALRSERAEFDFSQDKSEGLWREMDEEPAVTGEESALGMPSAGGANKSAADDYAASTTLDGDFGASDHNAFKPQKDQIISSAIDGAFRSNEEHDKSYGMGEPPTTQPHGSKYALSNPLSGGSSKVSFGAMPKGPGMPKMPTLPKIPQVKAPGVNIMSELKTNSNALLSSNSIMSGGTRAMGSPLNTGAQAAGAALT